MTDKDKVIEFVIKERDNLYRINKQQYEIIQKLQAQIAELTGIKQYIN